MHFEEQIGQQVKKVLTAIQRENEECVFPEGWSSEQRHGEAGQRFREEFAKQSEDIDRQAREAIGNLITGLLCDIHTIAESLKPATNVSDKSLLETPAK